MSITEINGFNFCVIDSRNSFLPEELMLILCHSTCVEMEKRVLANREREQGAYLCCVSFLDKVSHSMDCLSGWTRRRIEDDFSPLTDSMRSETCHNTAQIKKEGQQD